MSTVLVIARAVLFALDSTFVTGVSPAVDGGEPLLQEAPK